MVAGCHDALGAEVQRGGKTLVDTMASYIQGIKIPTMDRKPPDTSLTEAELTKYRQRGGRRNKLCHNASMR